MLKEHTSIIKSFEMFQMTRVHRKANESDAASELRAARTLIIPLQKRDSTSHLK